MKSKYPMEDFLPAEDKIQLKFLENHTHFLVGDIDEENVKKAIQWIAYENMIEEEGKILTLYINSFGGSLYDAFALIDVMNASKYPVSTVAIGSIFSAAFLIFISGAKNHRIISKNAGIMCHQFSDSSEGKYHDIKAAAKEHELSSGKMLEIVRDASGLDSRTIKSKLLGPSDAWLTSEELINYNLADRIL
jgi:ATP-dependent Clp protease protease subunit